MQLAHCCRYDGTRIIATSAASIANLASFGIAGAVTDYLEIAFIDPAAMTVSASHVFPSNADAAFTDTFAVTQNFVWCGSEVSGNLVKFAKAGLTIRTVLPTGALASGNSCYEVYNDGRFLWMGFDVAGVIVRVNPFTGALDTFTLPLGQPSVNSIWADDAGQNICFGNWLSSGAGTTALSSTPLAALQVW
jgi:streptogramin lyase